MLNSLPKKIRKHECGIINLDNIDGEGTHWTAYCKYNDMNVVYFDSFGNLKPPSSIVEYFKSSGPVKIRYNHDAFQNFNSVDCGHLCLEFLQYEQLKTNNGPFSISNK